MKLTNARLCLDCDEVYDEPQCPVCASESFAFIKRWVKAPERAPEPVTNQPVTNQTGIEKAAAYRALLDANHKPTNAGRLIRGGAVGLAVLGAAGWFLQRSVAGKRQPDQGSASGSDQGSGPGKA